MLESMCDSWKNWMVIGEARGLIFSSAIGVVSRGSKWRWLTVRYTRVDVQNQAVIDKLRDEWSLSKVFKAVLNSRDDMLAHIGMDISTRSCEARGWHKKRQLGTSTSHAFGQWKSTPLVTPSLLDVRKRGRCRGFGTAYASINPHVQPGEFKLTGMRHLAPFLLGYRGSVWPVLWNCACWIICEWLISWKSKRSVVIRFLFAWSFLKTLLKNF